MWRLWKHVAIVHAARHRKRCTKGAIYGPKCRYFIYNQQETNYHVAMKHAPSISKQATVWSSCEKKVPSFYSLR